MVEAQKEFPYVLNISFMCTVETLPHNLQLKMINLQCHGMLKGKYQGKNVTEFCKCRQSNECAQLK